MPLIERQKSTLLYLVFLLAFSSGCSRPFVEIANPDAEVVQPDLTLVQSNPDILLKIRVSSFRAITRVFVDSMAMSLNTTTDLWEAPFTLSAGMNMLKITSFDEEDRPGVDTVYALAVQYELDDTSPQLPTGLGGHTATMLSNGDVLITGGASSTTAPASPNAYLFSPTDNTLQELSSGMSAGRIGHSATNIGNDNVLIVGGGSRANIAEVSELNEKVELYDASTRSFREIAYDGQPIRRMFHTASYRSSTQGPVLDLIGGTGDVQYLPEPLLSIRADIRSFLLRNDSLLALSPPIGPFIERMSGHIQVPVASFAPGERATFLVTGIGGLPPGGPIGLLVDFTTNLGILVNPVIQVFSPRQSHAVARLDERTIGLFGGIGWPVATVLSSNELYLRDINRAFTLTSHDGAVFLARYSHTATLLSPGNILLLGGFNESGEGLTDNRIFAYSYGVQR